MKISTYYYNWVYYKSFSSSILWFKKKFISNRIFILILFLFCHLVYLQSNTMKLLWTYADKDPVYGHLKWHGVFSGVRPIHMLTPLWKKPNPSHNSNNRDTRQWDVTVKNVSHCYCVCVCLVQLFLIFQAIRFHNKKKCDAVM